MSSLPEDKVDENPGADDDTFYACPVTIEKKIAWALWASCLSRHPWFDYRSAVAMTENHTIHEDGDE